MERLGYGRERDYGGEDGHGHGDSGQVRGQQDGYGDEYQDWPDGDPVYEDFNDEGLVYDDPGDDDDDEEVQDFTGVDDYLAYYAAGTGEQTDAIAARFGWRGRARGNRRGKNWRPPVTRDHLTPLFVRVEDLPRRDGSSPADAPAG